MKSLSGVLNVVLILLLAGSGVMYFNQSLRLAEVRDRRPAGDTFALKHDMRVYLLGTPGVAFTLPQGTLLQDSTPKGMATLGKFYGQEFLLTLKIAAADGWQIDRDIFEPYSTSDGHYNVKYVLVGSHSK